MVAGYCENNITYEKYMECMGILSTEFIFKLTKNIKEKNIAEILKSVNFIVENGKNMGVLVNDMMEFYRNIFVVKTVKDYSDILILPENHIKMLKDISSMISERELLTYMQKLSQLDIDIKYALNPSLLCETTFIDMALYSDVPTISEGIDLDELIEKKLSKYFENNSKQISTITQPKFKTTADDVKLVAEEVFTDGDKLKSNTNFEPQKIRKIDNSIKNKEKNIIETKENKEIENVQERSYSVKINSAFDKSKVVGAFIGKARQKGLNVLLFCTDNCDFELSDNKLYFIFTDEMLAQTFELAKNDIERVIKSIDANLEYEIKVISKGDKTKTKESDRVKKKFGLDVEIK